jgi:hypothetical protein
MPVIYYVHIQSSDPTFVRRPPTGQVLTLPDRSGVLYLRTTYVAGEPSTRLLAFERYDSLAQFIWPHYEIHVEVQEALRELREPSPPPLDNWGLDLHRDDLSDSPSEGAPEEQPPVREILVGDSTDSDEDDEERDILLPPRRPAVEEEFYSDEEAPAPVRRPPQPRVEEDRTTATSDHSDTESSWSSESPQR